MKIEALEDIGLYETTNSVEFRVTCDMRYHGQGYEINVPFKMPPCEAGSEERLSEEFRSVYRNRYGREHPDGIAEIVSWRLEVSDGRSFLAQPAKANIDKKKTSFADARQVFFDNSYIETPVYHRQ